MGLTKMGVGVVKPKPPKVKKDIIPPAARTWCSRCAVQKNENQKNEIPNEQKRCTSYRRVCVCEYARRLYFNGIHVKITNITLEVSSNAILVENQSGPKCPDSTRAPQRCWKTQKSHSYAGRRRQKNVHGTEGRNANSGFLNPSNEITRCSKSIHKHNEFHWFFKTQKYAFVFWTPLTKYTRRIWRMRKSRSPNVTHNVIPRKTSNIPLEGFQKNKTVNGNEGGSNKKMWAATRVRTTKMTLSTPLMREAHFCSIEKIVDE